MDSGVRATYRVFFIFVFSIGIMGAMLAMYVFSLSATTYRNIPTTMNLLTDAANTAVSKAQKSKNVSEAQQIAQREVDRILDSTTIPGFTEADGDADRVPLRNRVASVNCEVVSDPHEPAAGYSNRKSVIRCTIVPKDIRYKNPFSSSRMKDDKGNTDVPIKPIVSEGVIAYQEKV